MLNTELILRWFEAVPGGTGEGQAKGEKAKGGLEELWGGPQLDVARGLLEISNDKSFDVYPNSKNKIIRSPRNGQKGSPGGQGRVEELGGNPPSCCKVPQSSWPSFGLFLKLLEISIEKP